MAEVENLNSFYKQLALVVYRRLLDFYGEPTWRTPLPPLDELISTILSQNTNDHNRDLAFTRLRSSLPTWEIVRDAKLTEIVEAIHSAGLSNQKGRRIQALLQEISAERGNLDLEFLRSLPRENALAWLLHFKGVGPKTAAIVLQFSLGIPAMPVDTHIYRVTGRLGLRPMGITVEQTHNHLEAILPPDSYYGIHLNLIRLGREICHARRPVCQACLMNDICPFYLAHVDGG
jgi:endonuclease III